LFDLRYHVASLAAVFLALIIGILVGAGLASRTDVDRRVLEGQIQRLERQNDDLTGHVDLIERERKASDDYVGATYLSVMNGRLRGMRVAMLFIGPGDDDLLGAVEETLADGSGPGLIELEALDLPVNADEVQNALDPQFADLALDDVGRRLAAELVAGGETPFWDALTPVLVQDHRGTSTQQADAVVVATTGVATDGPTSRFVGGLYAGLARSNVPVVGVERTDERPSRVAIYQTRGLSSVDCVDTQVGRVALAALLAGAEEGHYGIKRTAKDGPLPTMEPLPLAPPPGG
jgi:hypothetical protein